MRSAIIDIGYNAIRAVVYENDRLGSSEIFNTKFKNDILSLLASKSLDVKHQTYLSIQYLLHIFKNLEVDNIQCVATAVLRDHPRANDFTTYIKDTYDFDINIISGDEEARLTALGLISGIHASHGIAADLGGGSLELIAIDKGEIGKLGSLALGTKIINSLNIRDENKLIEIITEQYGSQTYENLYFIGGALRFIGRLYIDFMHYPIKNLHNLEIKTDEFSVYLDKLQNSYKENKLGKKKINGNAILVAKAMIEVFQPKKIIVSTYGLKEGVRFDSMPQSEKDKNIVLEKIQDACGFDQDTDFESYTKIAEPLVKNTDDFAEILQLAIILLSFTHKIDKTLPPLAISEFILSSEIPFTHRMRVMLALSLSYTTHHRPSLDLIKISKRLLSKQDYNNCQIIGYFLCIAEEIDGPKFLRPSFSIKINRNFLEIDSEEILPRPIFEKVCHKLKSIAYARKMNSTL